MVLKWELRCIVEKVELPALLPDEHLLSVLARWFDTTGRNDFLAMSSKVSSNNVMLTPSSIWRPIYSDLAHHYIDTVGLTKILSEHTLISFYKPFLREKEVQKLTAENLSVDKLFKIKPALQSHVQEASHWRWCSECAKDDYDEYGVTYWRTYHQIPTMHRCYKHNIPLLSKCQSCNFEYKNFQRHWLPPNDGECLECQAVFEPVTVLTAPTSNWLNAVSIALHQSREPIELLTLIKLMKNKLGYEVLPKNIPVALRKEVALMQVNFESWLQDDVINSYFKKNRQDIFKRNQKILNIVTTVYRDSQVPPISILLMLKSLGLEHELTKLLLR